jgi:hypothetical protein
MAREGEKKSVQKDLTNLSANGYDKNAADGASIEAASVLSCASPSKPDTSDASRVSQDGQSGGRLRLLASRFKTFAGLGLLKRFFRRFSSSEKETKKTWLTPLSDWMHPLYEGCTELSHFSESLEKRFLDIGTLLQVQSELSINLISEGDKLTSLTLDTGSEQTGDEGQMEHIWNSLQFMSDCRDKTQELLEHLETRQTQLNALLQKEAFWRQAIAPLKIIQTLFKISSASLPAEMKTVFVTLTEDIGKLYDQVTETFTSQFQALAATRISLDALICHMREQAGMQMRSLTKALALKKSYEELQVQLRESRSCEMLLSDLLRKNAEEVSRVVVGIQYQDITRQQLEHIVKGLGEMKERFDGADSIATPEQKQALAAYLFHAGRLQAGQLKAFQGEISEALRAIGDGVRLIETGIGKMEDKCQSVWEQRKAGILVDGMVQTWLDTLQDMRSMLTSSGAEMEKTLAFTKLFDGLAANVTTSIQRLAMSIRLIALNAQVQVARVGGDNGLEVLSERTRDLADEIAGFSFSIGSEIESLVGGLDEVSKDCGILKTEGLDRKHELDIAADKQETVLHHYRDRTLLLLGAVDDLFQQSKSHAQTMLKAVDFADFSCECILPIVESLTQISSYCADHVGSEAALAATAQQMDAFKTIYTMGSERAVHASVFAQDIDIPKTPIAEPPSPSPSAASAKAADLGDNVELF